MSNILWSFINISKGLKWKKNLYILFESLSHLYDYNLNKKSVV